MEEVKGRGIPEWLLFDAGQLSGRVASLPTREQINLPVQEQLIVELYSASKLQLPGCQFRQSQLSPLRKLAQLAASAAPRPQPSQTCGGRRGAKRQVWRRSHPGA